MGSWLLLACAELWRARVCDIIWTSSIRALAYGSIVDLQKQRLVGWKFLSLSC